MFTKLKEDGFIDHAALVAIIVGVAILGSFFLVATHAATGVKVNYSYGELGGQKTVALSFAIPVSTFKGLIGLEGNAKKASAEQWYDSNLLYLADFRVSGYTLKNSGFYLDYYKLQTESQAESEAQSLASLASKDTNLPVLQSYVKVFKVSGSDYRGSPELVYFKN